MKTKDAIAFFGSQSAVARALGITKQAVAAWGEVVPIGRAYQLQVITDGKLSVKPDIAAA